MHPGMFAFWHARRHGFGHHGHCGSSAAHEEHDGPGGSAEGEAPWGWHTGPHGGGGWQGGPGRNGGDDFGAGSFGVRRPLRFLASRLELDDSQVTELAAILNELKTERAQLAVDQRRTTSSLAEAVASADFDEAKATGAAGDRTKSTERVEHAVVRALARIHAILKPEQRSKLAYLLRTGALSM